MIKYFCNYTVLFLLIIMMNLGLLIKLAHADLVSDAHQCAMELCGPARENIDWSPNGAKLPPDIENQVKRELDPMIRKLVALQLKNRLRTLESFDKLAKRFESPNMSSIERAVLNLSVISFLMSSLTSDEMNAFLVIDQAGVVSINKKEFLQKFPQLATAQGELLILGVEAYLANEKVLRIQNIDSNMPFNLFLKSLSLNERPKDLILITNNLLKRIVVLDREGLSVLVPKSDREIVNKIRKTGKISLSEQREFIGLYIQLFLISAMESSELLPILSAPKLTFEQINSITHIDKIVGKGQDLLNSKEQSAVIAQTLINKLKRAVRSLIASGYTPLEKKVAIEMIEKVRNMAVQTIELQVENSKPELLIKAREAILQAKLEWPLSQSEAFAQAIKQLIMNISDVQERIDHLEVITNGGKHFTGLFAYILQDSAKETQADIINIDALIATYTPPELEDAAYLESKSLRVGWQTIKIPDFGVGILAHEFGHIVSAELEEGVLSVKVCTAYHHLLSDTFFDKLIPLYQAEEDWADNFSVAVMSGLLKSSLPSLNPGCLMLGWNKYSHDFNSLSMINLFRGDSHSSGLYRLIQIQTGLGKIPLSCVKATGLSESSNFFNSCVRH